MPLSVFVSYPTEPFFAHGNDIREDSSRRRRIIIEFNLHKEWRKEGAEKKIRTALKLRHGRKITAIPYWGYNYIRSGFKVSKLVKLNFTISSRTSSTRACFSIAFRVSLCISTLFLIAELADDICLSRLFERALPLGSYSRQRGFHERELSYFLQSCGQSGDIWNWHNGSSGDIYEMSQNRRKVWTYNAVPLKFRSKFILLENFTFFPSLCIFEHNVMYMQYSV